MAKKGRTYDGRHYCLKCGSDASEESKNCSNCGEEFDETVKAFNCPSCGAPIEFGSKTCDNCGREFKIVKPREEEKQIPAVPVHSDEDFLSRLLDWGRKKYEVETAEDKEEKKAAEEVFKTITGAIPAPDDIKAINELKSTAEEREKLLKREQDIGKIAEPLYNLITSRKKAIEEAEKQLGELREKLDDLKGSKKGSDEKKRKEIRRKIKRLEKEKADLANIEHGIKTIELVFNQLITAHEREIRAKEREMEKRLKEFKKEMARRQKEKIALKKREEDLKKRERELEKRVAEIAEREMKLKEREEELEKQLESLKKDSEKLAVANSAENQETDEDEAGFSEEEQKKWLEEQRRLQAEIFQLRSGDVEEDVDEGDYKGLETALKNKIKDLEEELTRIHDERKLMQERLEQAEEVDEEVRRILHVLDDLLENLPEDIIEKFAKSEDFKLYEKILDKYGI